MMEVKKACLRVDQAEGIDIACHRPVVNKHIIQYTCRVLDYRSEAGCAWGSLTILRFFFCRYQATQVEVAESNADFRFKRGNAESRFFSGKRSEAEEKMGFESSDGRTAEVIYRLFKQVNTQRGNQERNKRPLHRFRQGK